MEDRFLGSETVGDMSPIHLDEIGYHLDLDDLVNLGSQLQEMSPCETQEKRSTSRDKHRKSRSCSRDKNRRSRSRSRDKQRSRPRSRDRDSSHMRDKYRRDCKRHSSPSQELGSHSKRIKKRSNSRDRQTFREKSAKGSENQHLRLYVGNLHIKKVTQDTLHKIFSKYGGIRDIKMIKNFNTGFSLGFGFVTFQCVKDGEAALRKENGRLLEGRKMKVELSTSETSSHKDAGSGPESSKEDAEMTMLQQLEQFIVEDNQTTIANSSKHGKSFVPQTSNLSPLMSDIKVPLPWANRSQKVKSKRKKANSKSSSQPNTQSSSNTLQNLGPGILGAAPWNDRIDEPKQTISRFDERGRPKFSNPRDEQVVSPPLPQASQVVMDYGHGSSGTKSSVMVLDYGHGRPTSANKPVTEAPQASKMTFKQFLDQCDNSVTAEQAFLLYSEYTKKFEEALHPNMTHEQPPKDWSTSQNPQPYRSTSQNPQPYRSTSQNPQPYRNTSQNPQPHRSSQNPHPNRSPQNPHPNRSSQNPQPYRRSSQPDRNTSQSTQPNLKKIAHLLLSIDKKVVPQKEIHNSGQRIQQAIQEQKSVHLLINTKGQPDPHLSSLVIPLTRGLWWNTLQCNQIWDIELKTHGGSHIEMGGMDAKANGGGRERRQMSTRWSSTTATQDSAAIPSCPVRSHPPSDVSFRSQQGESSWKKANPKPRSPCQIESNTTTQPSQTEESYAIPLPDEQQKITAIIDLIHLKQRLQKLSPPGKTLSVPTLVTIPPEQIISVPVVANGVEPGQLIQVDNKKYNRGSIENSLFMKAYCVKVGEDGSFLLPMANLSTKAKIIKPTISLGNYNVITENDIIYLDWKGNPIDEHVPGEILSNCKAGNCSSSKVTQDDGDGKTALQSILKDLDWSHLTQGQRDRLEDLIVNNDKVFIQNSAVMGELKEPEAIIEATDPSSVRIPILGDPVVYKKNIVEMIATMLDNDVLEISSIWYLAPLVLVSKPDGSKRMCYDYRGLDKQIKIDVCQLPTFGSMMDNIGGKKYYCHLDLKDAYHQAYKDLGTNSSGLNVFRYKRMPIDFHVSPADYTSKMQQVLAPLVEQRWCCYYFDDIVLWGNSFDKVLVKLKKTLEKLAEMGIKLNVSKCSFGIKEITWLGHIFSEKSTRPDTKIIEAIKKIVTPTNVKEAKRIMGYFFFYKSSIHNFAPVASPITYCIKNSRKFAWSDSCENAFVTLKQTIETAVRSVADLSKPFELYPEMGNSYIGATLMQVDEDKCLKPICYYSKVLTPVEIQYSVTEKEALATVCSCRCFSHTLCSKPFTIVTDNQPLSAILGKEAGCTKNVYNEEMTKYTFDINIRKKQTVPNALSTPVAAVSNAQDITCIDPDEKLLELTVENSIEVQGEDEC